MFSFLLILIVSLVGVGCDSDSNDAGDLGDFLGDWQQVEDDPEADLFIRVEENQLTVAGTSPEIPGFAICTVVTVGEFDIEDGRVTGVDGDGEAYQSSISRNGDELTIDGDTFIRTNDFPTCNATL